MKTFRLPGLSAEQQQDLFRALERRGQVAPRERSDFPVPESLARSIAGQGWWALMQEVHDRPAFTLLGLVATVTYPVIWGIRQLAHWI